MVEGLTVWMYILWWHVVVLPILDSKKMCREVKQVSEEESLFIVMLHLWGYKDLSASRRLVIDSVC